VAASVAFGIIFGLGFYLFGCFVLFKICEKFGVGSLFECCIPIYNIVLLCRCADISGWNVLWLIAVVIPGVNLIVWVILTVVIWGRIAERMGRSFWQYGLGSAFLFGIPILVLAFGPAHPCVAGAVQGGSWEPDNYATPEPIYKPLPAYDTPVPATPSPVALGQSSVSVHCYVGELKGNTIPVPARGIVIGRDPAQCQIVLSSNELSRTHASIMVDRGNPSSIVLRDIQSTNGTFQQVQDSRHESRWERVNGSVVLGPGKRFRIGKGVAEFEVR
jgi:hypothetical protein